MRGRANLKLGKREVLEISAKQGFTSRRTIERYRRAKTKPERRKFLPRDIFPAKPYFNADYWIERLLKLIGLYGKRPRTDAGRLRREPLLLTIVIGIGSTDLSAIWLTFIIQRLDNILKHKNHEVDLDKRLQRSPPEILFILSIPLRKRTIS